MRYKNLRLVAVISLALTLTAFAGCMVQTFRLDKSEKNTVALRSTCSQDSSEVKKMQSEIDGLKKKEQSSSSSQANQAQFTYDAKIQANGPKIAFLTFDDGPSRNTPLLLSALKAAKVPATFFVIGTNCKTYPQAVKQIAAEGHAVGIHSWTHKYSYIYANTTNFMQDFNELRDYLTQQLGYAPDICRFPGGTNNTVSLLYSKAHIMKQIVGEVETMNIRPVDWNSSVGDAEKKVPSSGQMVRRVMSQIGDVHQPVVLMHDVGNRKNTINAIPGIVKELKARGYSFATLSAKTQAVMFQPS